MPYRIRLSPDAEEHLSGLTARQRSLITDTIERRLTDQPTRPSRNQQLMLPNWLAKWKLRIGDFRVFYNVYDEPEPTVDIQAIGVKVRNRLLIGGQEVKL